MIQIYPSLMTADLLNLGNEIEALNPYCAGFHIDIMDGHFVPNITFGPSMANAMDTASTRPSWVHLMVDNPSFWIKKLELKPKSLVSFHIETKIDIREAILHIKEKKYLTSLAINPKTPIEKLLSFLDGSVDHVLIMSVEPGFSGQKFIPEVLKKIPTLLEHREQHALSFTIGLDGGITAEVMSLIKKNEIDQIAAASSIFGYKDSIAALKRLQ